MARGQTPLYVGTGGYIAALDPATGEELWRAKLPRGGMTPVTMIMKGRYLYVGSSGRAFCLDKRDGTLIWENGLKKMGWGAVLMVMEGAEAVSSQDAAVTAEAQRQQAAAASAAGGASGT